MQRHGSVIKVRPEKFDEYKRFHQAVWPEVLAILTACHFRNYSIFHREDWLFSYLEYHGNDYDADCAHIAADPATQRWWALNKPCQDPLPTRDEGEWWAEMEELFHHD